MSDSLSLNVTVFSIFRYWLFFFIFSPLFFVFALFSLFLLNTFQMKGWFPRFAKGALSLHCPVLRMAFVLSSPRRLVDVAVNLSDCLFHGINHKGRRVHLDDFDAVMSRASDAGVTHMIITGTSYLQSKEAINLCRQFPNRLRCTVGVHPANCLEFLEEEEKTWEKEKNHVYVTPCSGGALIDLKSGSMPSLPLSVHSEPAGLSLSHSSSLHTSQDHAEAHLAKILQLIENNRDVIVAIGEIGLDFAELSSCPRDVQQFFFEKQLEAFAPLGLPFFFHSRDCGLSVVETLQKFLDTKTLKSSTAPTSSSSVQGSPLKPHEVSQIRGVVHSFSGTEEEQKLLLDMGMYLSINGSAFRDELLALRLCHTIPLDKLFLETDAPWCDIRKFHYGNAFIRSRPETTPKGKPFEMGKCVERRVEPCHLIQVMEAFLGVAAIGETSVSLSEEKLLNQLHQNCLTLFNWDIYS